jgi:hypothetical protein
MQQLTQQELSGLMGYKQVDSIWKKEVGRSAITRQDVLILKLRGMVPQDYPLDREPVQGGAHVQLTEEPEK